MKALVMIRVSTEAQSLEDQHNEMVRFCNDEGYDELIFVEDKGASAIKLNDSYRMMIEQVKEEIGKDPDIRCFAVWELSRAFRNEAVYVEVKNFLLDHNVQFLCKNPYLKLLNPDGSLNSGMEIAMSLLATLAKQEMEIKKERFKRAKDVMRKQGKFIGGRKVKYGYKVVDGYLVIDEETAAVVKTVFEMYSTGMYSVKTLWNELRERGYDINFNNMRKMLEDRDYIDRPIPKIISTDLWERCEKVRKKNLVSIPKGKRYNFGSGIFKCYLCGRNMLPQGARYRCWHNDKYAAPPHCENKTYISSENMDGLLWWVASKEEVMYRMNMDKDIRKEYEGQIEVLKKKIQTAEKRLEQVEEKKRRMMDLYVDGMITKEELKKRQNKTLLEVKTYNDTILRFNEEIGALLQVLEGNFEEGVTVEKIKGVLMGVLSESDLQMMRDIVRKHIRRVTAEPIWYGKDRDKRSVRHNALLITIDTVYSGVQKYNYIPRQYKGHYFYWYREDGAEQPIFSIKGIKR